MRLVLAALILALAGCEARPSPIAYGRDTCARCRMLISDTRYGAELVTRQGKVYKFDSIECLAGFSGAEAVPPADVRSLWVGDSARPGHLIDARTAFYLQSSRLRSPMGLGLAAFAARADRDEARTRFRGEPLAWDRIVPLVYDSGILEGLRAAAGRP